MRLIPWTLQSGSEQFFPVMSIMEAWACEPKANPYSLCVFQSSLSKVGPLRTLAALESCELIQLLLGVDALPQA
jgi:hypothetical protein